MAKVFGASGAFNNTQCYTLHAYTSSTAFRLDEGQGLVAEEATTMFTLYPNPASDHLNMQYDGTVETDATIRILNMLGQTISVSVQHVAPGEIVPLDISSLVNGNISLGLQPIISRV